MSLATVGNTAYNIWKGETIPVPVVQNEMSVDSVATSDPIETVDSTIVQNP